MNYVFHAPVVIRHVFMLVINVILKLFVTVPVKWMGTHVPLLVISKGLIITRIFVCVYICRCIVYVFVV